jgi:hypothetical protein
MAEAPGEWSASRVGSSPPSRRAPRTGTRSGWGQSRAKCGGRATLGRPGSRPAGWKHCRRRPNGHFRRGRTPITSDGSRATPSSLNDSGSRSRPARWYPRSMAAAHGTTAFLGDRGTRTSSLFIRTLPIPCASPLATDTSRATMPARRGARPAPVSRSATCAAWRSMRKTRRSSLYRPRPVRAPHTSLAARMAGCIAVSPVNAGNVCATVGRSRRPPSLRCSAPARKAESCGPRMSAACTARRTAGRVGGARLAMRRHRSTYAASRCCGLATPHRAPPALMIDTGSKQVQLTDEQAEALQRRSKRENVLVARARAPGDRWVHSGGTAQRAGDSGSRDPRCWKVWLGCPGALVRWLGGPSGTGSAAPQARRPASVRDDNGCKSLIRHQFGHRTTSETSG